MGNESRTALVEFQIREENASQAEWLETWGPRGQDALDGEPDTVAYGATVNLEDELNVLIFERYAHGDESLAAHMDRPAHDTLMKALGERNMTKRRVLSTVFNDIPGYGWWGRGPSGASRAPGNVLVIIGMRFGDEAQREKFLEISRQHADYCFENEADTLIYSGGIATGDADREIDVKSGDLIFVMACTNQEAVQKHAEDPNHLAIGDKLQEAGIEMQLTFMRSYLSTKYGYLWRE